VDKFGFSLTKTYLRHPERSEGSPEFGSVPGSLRSFATLRMTYLGSYHKNKLVAGFTQKYNVDRLVYFEVCSGIVVAIEREKQIKGWSRKRKQDLINS
jgi:hypothetical protein